MGVTPESSASVAPPTLPDTLRRSTRKRKSPISIHTSDSVQIIKVRKTGKPAFDDAPAPEPAPAPPPPHTYSRPPKPLKPKPLARPLSPPADPPSAPPKPEKRPRRFRDHPPQSVVDRLYRARSQRLFVLSRSGRQGLSETFTMAGSTGNVYTVKIGVVPSCNCPDGEKRNTCKHILYVMEKALRAPPNLVYQAGLLTSELETIFDNAPAPPSTEKSNRKPLDADDCPICFSKFEPKENIVWCKAQCGTNAHAACFREWKMTKGAGAVTCVMCRQPWMEGDTAKARQVIEGKEVGEDGYVNVADELGTSRERDTSTYSEWFTGNRGYGGYSRYGRY